jgi:hypothetical protein
MPLSRYRRGTLALLLAANVSPSTARSEDGRMAFVLQPLVERRWSKSTSPTLCVLTSEILRGA